MAVKSKGGRKGVGGSKGLNGTGFAHSYAYVNV